MKHLIDFPAVPLAQLPTPSTGWTTSAASWAKISTSSGTT